MSDMTFTAPGIDGYLCETCVEPMEDAEEVESLEGKVACAICEVEMVPGWNVLAYSTRLDLHEWYNQIDLDADGKALLATLYHDGRFHAYDCGHCGERVRQGVPEAWDNFQGCHNDEGLGELCGTCAALYFTLKDLADA